MTYRAGNHTLEDIRVSVQQAAVSVSWIIGPSGLEIIIDLTLAQRILTNKDFETCILQPFATLLCFTGCNSDNGWKEVSAR